MESPNFFPENCMESPNFVSLHHNLIHKNQGVTAIKQKNSRQGSSRREFLFVTDARLFLLPLAQEVGSVKGSQHSDAAAQGSRRGAESRP